MDIQQRCIQAYAKHKHLGHAGKEVGISWQNVYIHLKKAGVAVTGDKATYGTERDRFAARSEQAFLKPVPNAIDQNRKSFQSKIDFIVGKYGVDVKASQQSARGRYCFCVKKQEAVADFFVCFAYNKDEIKHCLLKPGELGKNCIRLTFDSKSLNAQYLIIRIT